MKVIQRVFGASPSGAYTGWAKWSYLEFSSKFPLSNKILLDLKARTPIKTKDPLRII